MSCIYCDDIPEIKINCYCREFIMPFTQQEIEQEATRLLKMVWPMAYIKGFTPDNAIYKGFMNLALESLTKTQLINQAATAIKTIREEGGEKLSKVGQFAGYSSLEKLMQFQQNGVFNAKRY